MSDTISVCVCEMRGVVVRTWIRPEVEAVMTSHVAFSAILHTSV